MMKHQQQQQAQHLYFQTELSKTQIAEAIGVSRTTLHHWVRTHNWEHLKRSGAAMPSLIAGNCYQMMAQLSEHILSDERKNKPVTREEVESLYKLTLTISKLKARVTLSESMETFAGFVENVHNSSPELAEGIEPLISSYLSSCATITTHDMKPKRPGNLVPASPDQDHIEALLDQEDLAAWAQEQAVAPASSAVPTPVNDQQRNTAENSAPPRYDIRKQLRGTASKGPGKAFHHNQDHPVAAA